MSMRSQIYAWNGANFNPALAAATPPGFVPGTSGTQISIFIGGFGNNITKPAETTATEFVVIEDVSCTPSLLANSIAASAATAGAALAVGQLAGLDNRWCRCRYLGSSCLCSSSYQHN